MKIDISTAGYQDCLRRGLSLHISKINIIYVCEKKLIDVVNGSCEV